MSQEQSPGNPEDQKKSGSRFIPLSPREKAHYIASVPVLSDEDMFKPNPGLTDWLKQEEERVARKKE